MSNMNEQAALDRMAAARMQVAALHNALKMARGRSWTAAETCRSRWRARSTKR
jgi:hypothetical protein